jgi:hypothetical protein
MGQPRLSRANVAPYNGLRTASPPGPPRHGSRTALISLGISILVRFHKIRPQPYLVVVCLYLFIPLESPNNNYFTFVAGARRRRRRRRAGSNESGGWGSRGRGGRPEMRFSRHKNSLGSPRPFARMTSKGRKRCSRLYYRTIPLFDKRQRLTFCLIEAVSVRSRRCGRPARTDASRHPDLRRHRKFSAQPQQAEISLAFGCLRYGPDSEVATTDF